MYFKDFPVTLYKFGNQKTADRFQNLVTYVDIFDKVKDNISFYQEYTILDNERPDQVAFKLYDNPDLHWVFFLMNDILRERGWPLSNNEIYERAIKDHSYTIATTRDEIFDIFKEGATVVGNQTGVTATIIHRELDLGQIYLDDVSGTFRAGERLRTTNPDFTQDFIRIQAYESAYLAAHHYENSDGEIVDIDPFSGPGALVSEVSHLDHYIRLNNQLKTIKVVKPSSISILEDQFREAVRS